MARDSAITFPHDLDGLITVEVAHDGWEMISRWRTKHGRPEPIEVQIHGYRGSHAAMTAEDLDELPPITAEAIRRLPLGEMLSESRKQIYRVAESVRDAKSDHPPLAGISDEVLERLAVKRGKPQRGQALSAADLAEVAKVYRAAWMAGLPVNEAVREAFYLSKDGAAKRISKARKEGLLDGLGPKR